LYLDPGTVPGAAVIQDKDQSVLVAAARTIHGLLGTKEFRTDRARLFFTEQHGENNLFEVFPRD
jgi:hypothetical protein